MTTLAELAEKFDRPITAIDDELRSEIEVPVLTTPQRQGDISWYPRAPLTDAELTDCVPIDLDGVNVVVGEATGNRHELFADPRHDVIFGRRDSGVLIGVLFVPDGSEAWMRHTDEHGFHGIGPSTYSIRRKREQRDEIERVRD